MRAPIYDLDCPPKSELMAASSEGHSETSQPKSATTLRTIVELIRRIMHADVASIYSFSLGDETVNWKAASGFRSTEIDFYQPVRRPFAVGFARQALADNTVTIFEGIGLKPELPAENFPVHVADGVHSLAVAPLRISGDESGAVTAGFRTPHHFTKEEKRLLQDLADMAAVALENARLLESGERYRELFENANDIVYTHDLKGHVTSINKAGESLGGYSRAELMKMNMSDLLLPASWQLANEMQARKLAGEEQTNYEVEIKVRDGKVQTLEISSRLIMKNGEPVGVQGIARDITDRKHTEDALRESEERARRGQTIWEQTFDAIGEGILVYDKDKTIVRCNAGAAEMMEIQPEAVIGLSFGDAFARLFGRQAVDYYLAESRDGSSAFEVRTESGRLNLVSIFPIEHPDGDSYNVVTLNDVTRLSEMQEQLGRSRRLASVGQLAAGVAHEINNPLAAITTCAEATMRDLRQTVEFAELAESRQWNYYLDEIVRQALRCKEITRGLLDLTRQRRAQKVTCDLNLIVRQCAKVALQRAGSVIEFAIDIDNNVGEVATDEAMVRQILDNLMSNAIDAIGEKEGKVTVATTRDGDRIAIEVRDTGCGIPPDSLARIFDPFFSMKGPGKGYGLGLAISSTLAESLGGAITVESKLEAGSRFSLWIPRRAPEE
jgi:PAS domain S-box-containing protein